MKIIGKFFEQQTQPLAALMSSNKGCIVAAHGHLSAYAALRAQSFTVNSGEQQQTITTSYGELIALACLPLLDAIITIEAKHGQPSLGLVYRVCTPQSESSSATPPPTTLPLPPDILFVSACQASGHILASSRTKARVVQIDATSDRLRYVPLLDLVLPLEADGCLLCRDHVAFFSKREVYVIRVEMTSSVCHDTSEEEEQAASWQQHTSLSFSRLGLPTCTAANISLPSLDLRTKDEVELGCDLGPTPTAAFQLSSCDKEQHHVVAAYLQLRQRIDSDDKFTGLALCLTSRTTARGLAGLQSEQEVVSTNPLTSLHPRAPPCGQEVGMFVSTHHAGKLFHAGKQQIKLMATYDYALPEPAVSAAITQSRVFVYVDGRRPLLYTYNARLHVLDDEGPVSLDAGPWQQRTDVLWLGTESMIADVRCIHATEGRMLALVDTENGQSVHAADLVKPIDFFDAVDKFANETPQNHPNVFQMRNELSYSVRHMLTFDVQQKEQWASRLCPLLQHLVRHACEQHAHASLAALCLAVPNLNMSEIVKELRSAEFASDDVSAHDAISELLMMFLRNPCLHARTSSPIHTATHLLNFAEFASDQVFCNALLTIIDCVRSPSAISPGVSATIKARLGAGAPEFKFLLTVTSLLWHQWTGHDVSKEDLLSCWRLRPLDIQHIGEEYPGVFALSPSAGRVGGADKAATEEKEGVAVLSMHAPQQWPQKQQHVLGPFLSVLSPEDDLFQPIFSWMLSKFPIEVVLQCLWAAGHALDSTELYLLQVNLLLDAVEDEHLPRDRLLALLHAVLSIMVTAENRLGDLDLKRLPVPLSERPAWLDSFPPFTPSYVPGLAASAAYLAVLRQVQAMIFFHHLEEHKDALVMLESLNKDGVGFAGFLSLKLQILLQQRDAPRVIDIVTSCQPSMLAPVLKICAPLPRDNIDTWVLALQTLERMCRGDESERLPGGSSIPREVLQRAYINVLMQLAAAQGLQTVLSLVPSDGAMAFFLPVLTSGARRDHADGLAVLC